ncbi:MAG: 50S ribosomal protein L32 [Candidatus Nealsonbacteria bacterium]|nr:50S ribosomal protein L32 [Candidatus Nealsonbacteria bacterium]
MAVPKQHRSKSRQGQRRMHIHLNVPEITVCPKCGKPILPHTVCQACGFYKGREVIDILGKLDKKEKKKKQKEMAQREKESKTEKSLSMEDLSRK